jgi:hypothetical protein
MRWQLLGERRALSLLVMGFYTTVFLLTALALGGAWARCFVALAVVYGVGFFGIAAEWFWGRWYAMGIGMGGITSAVIGAVTIGLEPGLLLWGGLHLAIYLPLLGDSMADRYENQEAWRQRYGLDRHGKERLRRAVVGAAAGLPSLVLFALAPRQESLVFTAVVLLAGLGLLGMLRMRFWGVGLLGLSLVGLGVGLGLLGGYPWLATTAGGLGLPMLGLALVAGLGLTVAVSPFLIPAYQFLKRTQ